MLERRARESWSDRARRARRAVFPRTVWTQNLQTPLRWFLRTETGSAAVLLAATLAALAWANIGTGQVPEGRAEHPSPLPSGVAGPGRIMLGC